MLRDRRIQEGEATKKKWVSSGKDHIYSKSNLLSQLFSTFFWLLVKQRKKYDGGRELSLSFSFSQTFC
jgi:hypothetical protein